MKTKRSGNHTSKDANFRLTHDLTPQILQRIRELPDDPRCNYLKSQVATKFLSSETASPLVRRTAAIRKWLATERNNEATNVRLLTTDEGYKLLPHLSYGCFMKTVQRIIVETLGEVPPFETLFGGFSGGASTSRKRTEGHPAGKYIGEADVTLRAKDYAESVLADSILWSQFFSSEQIRTVPGNVLFTVDKTSDIDRCAAKEPDLNMYMQRGVGHFIRSALRRKGIDLNDQSRNRSLAHKGSITGALATIDLSSASDSICTELVAQCLPIHWFVMLDALRCHVTVIDGEEHVNEMFSSMGNGFTFELESLLFYAIAKALAYKLGVKGIISVYGDDIIVPSDLAEDLIEVLDYVGFSTNVDKTFISGPFRESCGGHYYEGFDITPFYIKAPVTHLVDLIHVLNQMRIWSSSGCSILRDDLEDLWVELSSIVPKCFWGGVDPSDKSRLVSYWRPDKPKRLIPHEAEPKPTGDGGYLLWLNVVEHRISDISEGLETSFRIDSLKTYASKRVFSDVRYEGPIFLNEVNVPND